MWGHYQFGSSHYNVPYKHKNRCTSRYTDQKNETVLILENFLIQTFSEIGRTGRAGHKGEAITFFTQQDTVNLRRYLLILLIQLYITMEILCIFVLFLLVSRLLCALPDVTYRITCWLWRSITRRSDVNWSVQHPRAKGY